MGRLEFYSVLQHETQRTEEVCVSQGNVEKGGIQGGLLREGYGGTSLVGISVDGYVT